MPKISLLLWIPSILQDAFDLSFHPFQLYSITISQNLRTFFKKSSDNSIAFWDCPSNTKWCPHLAVDKEIKQLNIDPIFLCKLSWDFSKKEECDSILQNWQMIFQASDYKGNNFLDLVNDNNSPIRPTYSKEEAWLKHLGHSNSLCV